MHVDMKGRLTGGQNLRGWLQCAALNFIQCLLAKLLLHSRLKEVKLLRTLLAAPECAEVITLVRCLCLASLRVGMHTLSTAGDRTRCGLLSTAPSRPGYPVSTA